MLKSNLVKKEKSIGSQRAVQGIYMKVFQSFLPIPPPIIYPYLTSEEENNQAFGFLSDPSTPQNYEMGGFSAHSILEIFVWGP